LTTAKYYTPSGRCIQAIDYAHRKEDGSWNKIPDSLMTEFKTRKGRSVYDGGGIAPDLDITPPEYHKITQELSLQYVIFDFATEFARKNASIPPAREFQITDAIYNDFKQFVAARNFSYTTKAEKELNDLREVLRKEGYKEKIKSEIDELESNLKEAKKDDINVYRNEIERLLKSEIASRYYYKTGRLETSFATDPDIAAAVSLLNDMPRYNSILKKK
jgi:carboxyl-terminal processing protease